MENNMEKDGKLYFFTDPNNPDKFSKLTNLSREQLEARLVELHKKREHLMLFSNDATSADGEAFSDISDEEHAIKLNLARLQREEKETATN